MLFKVQRSLFRLFDRPLIAFRMYSDLFTADDHNGPYHDVLYSSTVGFGIGNWMIKVLLADLPQRVFTFFLCVYEFGCEFVLVDDCRPRL
jgi:hypothetical protein